MATVAIAARPAPSQASHSATTKSANQAGHFAASSSATPRSASMYIPTQPAPKSIPSLKANTQVAPLNGTHLQSPRTSAAGSCSHILTVNENDKFTAKFRLAVRMALQCVASVSDFPQGKGKGVLPTCSVCLHAIARPTICLVCGAISCFNGGHAIHHLRCTGHILFLDVRTQTIYCGACNDFIYHRACEVMVTSEKRRLHDLKQGIEPTKDSDWHLDPVKKAELQPKLTPMSCRVLRGFRNLGQTCFMSVILQTFLANPLLRNYYLADRHNLEACPKTKQEHADGKLSSCISCELDKLVQEDAKPNPSNLPFTPSSFLTAMWKSAKDLAGYSQQDAHEFLIAAMNAIHSSTPGHSDSSKCSCIVHTIFSGELRSDVKCGKCGNVTTATDPMLDINLEIVSPKRKNNGIGEATLNGCLQRFTAAERMGTQQYSCAKCKAVSNETTKQLSIKNTPPVLCIQLKRFEHNTSSSKIDTYCRFPATLDLRPYTTISVDSPQSFTRPGVKDDFAMYDLFGVVNHVGQLNNGHYTSYVKEKNEWYRFDDDKMRLASMKEVLDSNPYILLYLKRTLEYAR